MKTAGRFVFAATCFLGLAIAAGPSRAQDCDSMVGEIDQLLRTADLTQEQKDQVMQLRDQGMDQNSRAGGDCTTPLSQALDILKGG
jgi:hypothetical protein